MEWDPTQFFREDEEIRPHRFALVVLNQPINETALAVLRKHAHLTVCADGGANRFFEWAKARGEESTDLPTTIIGDLDSIRPEIRNHYANLGVNIVQDDDQYSTDFTKSLRYIREHEKDVISSSTSQRSQEQTQAPSILILGGLGGRVDQAFSQIHHLYMVNQTQEHGSEKGNLYLISEESITFILSEGNNTIHVPRTNRPPDPSQTKPQPSQQQEKERNEYLLEENIGIIPLSGPARITTSGFQWDVSNWETQIGGQISTSNHIRAETVSVQTNIPVLFTVELAGRLKRVSR
ncbi:thiamine diphosphokinase [Aspergillus undulatus]|uniref:thiamine diphosphokinase n=1 Tax=Aspergillus undulatus TaxID=1810928 RepID=UPI003CCD2BB9